MWECTANESVIGGPQALISALEESSEWMPEWKSGQTLKLIK
jgi:hypothetical protein